MDGFPATKEDQSMIDHDHVEDVRGRNTKKFPKFSNGGLSSFARFQQRRHEVGVKTVVQGRVQGNRGDARVETNAPVEYTFIQHRFMQTTLSSNF